MQSSKRTGQDEVLGEVEVPRRKKWQSVEHKGHNLLIIFAGFLNPLAHHNVSSLHSMMFPCSIHGPGIMVF